MRELVVNAEDLQPGDIILAATMKDNWHRDPNSSTWSGWHETDPVTYDRNPKPGILMRPNGTHRNFTPQGVLNSHSYCCFRIQRKEIGESYMKYVKGQGWVYE